ncbi:hypothetical protein OU994_25805 [Pseudoduganella sp. SL102]|uniref:hypothetical protein n=1 Tax=Pseudoduganella sp. SL102 TaxID=2995154 RepID=UPI00248B9DA4|nr:hypothetical protein [Pseudoduganella sp. SL102]WBS01645.1 hypothetical protein OU994_25805 [Pseudoduganella sp. SL102]
MIILRIALFAAALTLPLTAHTAEGKATAWSAKPRPLRGDYQVYGGTLSEMLPPTHRDRKIAMMFKGPLAKELFEQIGPDEKASCSDAADYRERNRGDLSCTYTKEDGHACYFGIDVISGKAIIGSIC